VIGGGLRFSGGDDCSRWWRWCFGDWCQTALDGLRGKRWSPLSPPPTTMEFLFHLNFQGYNSNIQNLMGV